MDSEPNIRNKLSRGKFTAVLSDPMLRGYRSIVFALVGLTLWSQALRAQGVSSPSPAPKEQPAKTALTSDWEREPTPHAVTVVDSTDKADASERREAEIKQHDARDLDAQMRAANAAEDQIFPAWLGALLSFAGTGLIVWTLFLTRKANAIAQDTARRQLRAYIGCEFVRVEKLSNGNYVARVFINNFGQTPALKLRYAAIIVDDANKGFSDFSWEMSGEQYLAPTQEWGLPVNYNGLSPSKDELVLLCQIWYSDAFGRRWRLQQRYVSNDREWLSDKAGNQEDEDD